MSTALVWAVAALILIPQAFMVGLTFAPKSFWRGLATKHRATAHFLWGFSHLFGPLSRPGGPPAWELMPDPREKS